MKHTIFLTLALICLAAAANGTEGKIETPDLATIADGKGWKVVNTTAETVTMDGRQAVRLKATGDSANGIAGLAWPVGLEFSTGVIEVDLKGKNVPQASFLGIVFNLVDEKKFEAIYFRPFNFKADESKRDRSVQYVAWPKNTWEHLRKTKPGQFENPVNPVPDPDGWFHARIEVTGRQVRVFVDQAREPSLVVGRLAQSNGKRPAGLFVDSADGVYANLRITSVD